MDPRAEVTSSTVKAYDGGIPILDQLGPIPTDVEMDNEFLREFMTVFYSPRRLHMYNGI